MDEFRCFKCWKYVKHGVSGLSKHLRHFHGLSVKAGNGREGFFCGQGTCVLTFAHFRNLKSHLLEYHSKEGVSDGSESNVSDGSEDNVSDRDVDMAGNDDLLQPQNGRPPSLCEPIDFTEEPDFDLESSLLRMVVNLRCNSSVTFKVINQVMDESSAILEDTAGFLKSKVTEFLKNKNLMTDPDAEVLLQSFNIKDPFATLRTEKLQTKLMKEKFCYIEPREEFLGYRTEMIYDKKAKANLPTQIRETFQYVSPIDILKLILTNPDAVH